MEYRQLGSTGIRVSAISFGAGPVPALMTCGQESAQRETVARAVSAGMNWFDTAATYGDGRSEASLGAALGELRAPWVVHVATKVRLMPDDLAHIRPSVKASLEGSLRRLGLDRVTLLQLHNSITPQRGDQHTSITPADVLGRGGVLEAFEELRSAGLVGHFGLTGLGEARALAEVIGSGRFATIQVAYHLANPSAGGQAPAGFGETDYGDLIGKCAGLGMGVIAIRVFAGGALAGRPPSQHTLATKFFPLALYERDQKRAAQLAGSLPDGMGLKEAAVRFVLSHPRVSTALVGFADPHEIDEAVEFAAAGPLPQGVRLALAGAAASVGEEVAG